MERTFYTPTYTLYEQGKARKVYGFNDSILIDSGSHRRLSNGSWDGGGSLYVRKREFNPSLVMLKWFYIGDYTHTPYIGTFTDTPTAPLTAAQVETDRVTQYNNTWSYGATGWKRARPGNPVANVATFVGELREGLPRIPFRLYGRLRDLIQGKAAWRRLHGTNLGDEYLNGVFGWVPLWNDLKKMYELSSKLDEKLAQIVRDNGKGVHRKRIIKDSSSSTVSTVQGSTPFWGWQNAPANIVNGGGRVDTVTTNIEKVWFAGRFRYYIPDIGTNQWKRSTIARLYGANFTPEVAWNLLPWSWLFDWFGNVGDVMSNASSNAVDNLVADYAYVMRTLETRTEHHGTAWWGTNVADPSFKRVTAGQAAAYAVNTTVYKLRSAGSPYGFGANFDSLTNYQAGVVAALGISRW